METPLHPHFKEFLELCRRNEVECLIIGGYAVNFHGYPRPTGDIDIWVNRTGENAERVARTVETFLGERVNHADFANAGYGFQIGVSPVRIDLHTDIAGLEFVVAESRAVETMIDGLEVRIIGLEDLLENKRSTGRLKDAADVEELLRGRGRKL